jgi:chloramphenicol O-acetyltransferase type A
MPLTKPGFSRNYEKSTAKTPPNNYMNPKTEIDLTTYPKRNQYTWFSTFPDPSYGFDVDIDVEAVVALAKKRGDSFFPYFFYLVMKGVHSVPELHLREEKGHIYRYENLAPTWTVMSEAGIYNNIGCEMEWNFNTFYTRVHELTEKAKKAIPNGQLNLDPLIERPDVVYATCIPQLEIVAMRHPTPSGDHDNLSIPRICWDKFRKKEDGHYHLILNITVSHTLVDGFPLAQCFNQIKADCLAPEKILVR